MTLIERIFIVLMLAMLAGCAAQTAQVKAGVVASESTVRSAQLLRLQDAVLTQELRIGDLENQVAVKDAQIAELTDMLVAAELARTDHLVAGSDGR